MWLVPAADRPQGDAAQTRWLYDWWQRLDSWVEGQGEEEPSEQGPGR